MKKYAGYLHEEIRLDFFNQDFLPSSLLCMSCPLKIISEELFHEKHQTHKRSDLPGKEMRMRQGQV